MNDLSGHNLPPDMAITAGETAKALSDWMAENPIITNEDEAREAKVYVDRAFLCIQDLEDERTAKVKPLNQQVAEINDHYRAPRTLLEKVVGVLKERMGLYLYAEEKRRAETAFDKSRTAAEAENVARDAELYEKQQIEDNLCGVLGGDIAGATAEADAKFAEYRKADRAAAIAERESIVKIGGGYRRSLSLRNKETIIVTDIHAAIDAIGVTSPRIVEAVESAARSYKKIYGTYPTGIETHIERKA